MISKIVSTIPHLVMLATLVSAGWLFHGFVGLQLVPSVLGAGFVASVLVRPLLLSVATLAVCSGGFGLVGTDVLARKLYLDHFDREDDWLLAMIATLVFMGFALIFLVSVSSQGDGWAEMPASGPFTLWSIVGCMAGITALLVGDHAMRSRFGPAEAACDGMSGPTGGGEHAQILVPSALVPCPHETPDRRRRG